MDTRRSGASLPVPQTGVVFRAVSDGAVLLHAEDEVYFGLNRTGARIWQLMSESEDVNDLCSRLAAEYPDVGQDRLRSDVVELLDRLLDSGLLRNQ